MVTAQFLTNRLRVPCDLYASVSDWSLKINHHRGTQGSQPNDNINQHILLAISYSLTKARDVIMALQNVSIESFPDPAEF